MVINKAAYRLYNASSISIVWGNVIIKFPLVIFENVQNVQCIFSASTSCHPDPVKR